MFFFNVTLCKKSELALANAQFQFIKQTIIYIMKHTKGLLTFSLFLLTCVSVDGTSGRLYWQMNTVTGWLMVQLAIHT